MQDYVFPTLFCEAAPICPRDTCPYRKLHPRPSRARNNVTVT
jgi:hypothetical protein